MRGMPGALVAYVLHQGLCIACRAALNDVCDSHGRPRLVQYTLRLGPLVDVACAPPQVKLTSDSVYELLLLPGLCEIRSALIVESNDYLLETIYGVVLHVMSHRLFQGGGVQPWDQSQDAGLLTSKSAQTFSEAILNLEPKAYSATDEQQAAGHETAVGEDRKEALAATKL